MVELRGNSENEVHTSMGILKDTLFRCQNYLMVLLEWVPIINMIHMTVAQTFICHVFIKTKGRKRDTEAILDKYIILAFNVPKRF